MISPSNFSTLQPFSAIVGLSLAKRALLLLAIDPSLKGVLIESAGAGTGKTSLVRAFTKLLPEEVQTRFCELPLGISEDRLLGGIDLERTLYFKSKHLQQGLLAEADGGLVYCDNVNLLDASKLTHLSAAIESGVVQVEREGLSAVQLARFMFVGTYSSSESEMARSLASRVGMSVSVNEPSDAEDRLEVLTTNLSAEAWKDFELEDGILHNVIADAREALSNVVLTDDVISELASAALALGVEGNAADIFAVKCALASAALDGRTEVLRKDLELAIKLVLLPRATQLPEQAPPPEPPAQEEQQDEPSDRPPEDQLQDEPESSPPEEEKISLQELVMEAMATDVPASILQFTKPASRKSASGSRGENYTFKRGRHIRSVASSAAQGRIDLLATIQAAMPFQSIRKKDAKTANASGVRIQKADMRVKQYKDKAGVLFIFIVDASGSMALNRMRQAKGAVARLLQESYIHRDKVALIAFRGETAQTLLPPTQSVERAKKYLDTLPTGGASPLAAALLEALHLAALARKQQVSQILLVLITDGKSNVPLKPQLKSDEMTSKEARKAEIDTELSVLSKRILAEGLESVVIDTQTSFVSRGEAASLARRLGGRYVYLPKMDAAGIADAVKTSVPR
ncbi:MAG: magnesium chelatase ATPase subunit D [Rhizobacter sp.]|nr:magnesium chelatase ATPase subunit D [Chlorobiales bacterium]